MASVPMAIYKAQTHLNYEDLDVDDDYSGYGIIKVAPICRIPENHPFITDFDIIEEDDEEGYLRARGLSWLWYTEGQTTHPLHYLKEDWVYDGVEILDYIEVD